MHMKAITTIKTNYHSTIKFTEEILPRINEFGKIVFVSSEVAQMTGLKEKNKTRIREG